MRIYATAATSDLKTVKKQGIAIATAWQEQNGLRVDVGAIKRLGNDCPERQWGFVVLESLFSTYLCHYAFEGFSERGVRLHVTPEQKLNTDNRQYLECPEKLLGLAEVENSHWRECVRTYSEAIRGMTPKSIGDQATVFILKGYSERQYSEPFHVLQLTGKQWFGIDCYAMKRPLSLSLIDIHAHCPQLIDVKALRPMESALLASDCVDTGLLIYKKFGDRATLLGRPMTNEEITQDRLSRVPRVKFELHGDCPWAA
uniref:Uncharacterized protein n=2 Tax=Pseudomonas fluorescens TaxID=294 RepID=A0A0G4E561_PSEFS|nr:hypothetical protein PQBR57_0418 [Pseudomonas fluorescens SBW25]